MKNWSNILISEAWALLRAAAKNYINVLVISDPKDYGLVLQEIQNPLGVTDELRHKLAVKAYAHTAHYDAVIASHLKTRWNIKEKFSEETTIGLRKNGNAPLRRKSTPGGGSLPRIRNPPVGVVSANVLQGKEISFNNYLDCEAAWQLALSFTEPACVIVKHNNPCGVARR